MTPRTLDNVFNVLAISLIVLGLSVAVGGVAHAEPAVAAPKLIWSAKTAMVIKSTNALAKGDTAAAINLASEALTRVQGKDRVIAQHNLCLAHLQRNDTAGAAAHCAAARALAPEAANARIARNVIANIEMSEQAAQVAATR
ncbi:MAG: hypothetical protein SFV19_12330 [Rhodospirillaceae bacterium]|nr:hypothetical protein [Rhodospirillaceae bacterium]